VSQQRGLFLDFDGTLANSLTAMNTVYMNFLSFYGVVGSKQEFEELNEPTWREIVSILRKKYSLTPSEKLLSEQYFSQIHKTYLTIEPNPGAKELLEFANQKNWPCSIVSSNSEKIINSWLERVGLRNYIKNIVAMEHITHSKPSPEPYLKALTLANCKPTASFAVEDSLAGVRAARAASIPTFYLLNNSTEELEKKSPILNLEKISNLTEMIEKLKNK